MIFHNRIGRVSILAHRSFISLFWQPRCFDFLYGKFTYVVQNSNARNAREMFLVGLLIS